MLVDMPGGKEQGSVYLVDYNEDLWLSFDDEGRQYCKDTWYKKAEVIPGCKFVTLRLIPDDLFPMHGHEKPYVAWQQSIERAMPNGFVIDVQVTVTVEGDGRYVDPIKRMRISKALEGTAATGTPWRIINAAGNVLEHGII